MSLILALDSVTELCHCALYRQGVFLARQCDELGKGHGEHLIGQIETLLHQTGVDKNSISRIGVNVGPGSFTGMRIGVATARSLARALAIEAVGVNRFEAIHYGIRQAYSQQEECSHVIILPSVQNKFSVQIFDEIGQALTPPHQAKGEEIIAQLLDHFSNKNRSTFKGKGSRAFSERGNIDLSQKNAIKQEIRAVDCVGQNKNRSRIILGGVKHETIENFLKDVVQFFDKSCCKNKEVERRSDSRIATDALEQNNDSDGLSFAQNSDWRKIGSLDFKVEIISAEAELDAIAAIVDARLSSSPPPSPLYMRPPDAKPTPLPVLVSYSGLAK